MAKGWELVPIIDVMLINKTLPRKQVRKLRIIPGQSFGELSLNFCCSNKLSDLVNREQSYCEIRALGETYSLLRLYLDTYACCKTYL